MLENYMDWTISNQAANSGRLNDYPGGEYSLNRGSARGFKLKSFGQKVKSYLILFLYLYRNKYEKRFYNNVNLEYFRRI